MSIRDVRKKRSAEFLAKRGVIMVGIGEKVSNGRKTGKRALVIGVDRKRPLEKIRKADQIPSTIDGELTDVVEAGAFSILPPMKSFEYTDRQRPCDLGVSVGHHNITAGTAGALVRRNGQTFLLSNNHVLANSNEATRGDEILQPGAYDGGIIGRDALTILQDFVPIDFGDGDSDPDQCQWAGLLEELLNLLGGLLGSRTRFRQRRVQAAPNLVDAAIAGPVTEVEVRHYLRGNPVGTAVTGVANGTVGMAVHKSGRTTEYTQGEILYEQASVQVQYGAGQVAMFEDQLIAGPMSAGGDSGSLVLERSTNRAVGLLFAGSDQFTIMNRIQNVEELLGCEIVGAN